MQKRFIFRVGKNLKCIRKVFAEHYEQAAVIVARRNYGNATSARRLTGLDHPDCCAYYQAYATVRTSKGDEVRDLGEPFYLQRLYTVETTNGVQTHHDMFDGLKYVKQRDLK